MTFLRLAIAGLLLSGIACNQDEITRLKRENRELAAKLEAMQKASTLDAQAKCAQQARVEFNAQGWSKSDMATFTNHYNQKLNKCFMETVVVHQSEPFVPNTYRTVIDAFEGKVYTDYFWENTEGKKYWEVAPFECKVTTVAGEEVRCKTAEEYEALIKQFMGQ